MANRLAQAAGCCRFAWNQCLDIQKQRLDNKENILSYSELAKLLVLWKKDEKRSFLKNVPSQPLQQALMNLDRALREAFAKNSPKKFPKFKKRGISDSFRFPQGVEVNKNRVFLPKIGWIPFFCSAKVEGVIKNATVSKRGKHWYVSIQVEMEAGEPEHPSTSSVGIDMGVCRFATMSDGTYILPLHSFGKLEKKLAREQRSLARKVRGSNNWKRQKLVISQIHVKIADARHDFLHKHSTRISKNHALVVMEELDVAKMTCKQEKHGSKRKKSRLNKAILDQGWYEFRRQIEYKQKWRGGRVELVDPANTSRRCPACSWVSKENRKSQEKFACIRCGHAAHADEVAANNILMAVGHTVSACGDTKLVAV